MCEYIYAIVSSKILFTTNKNHKNSQFHFKQNFTLLCGMTHINQNFCYLFLKIYSGWVLF